MTRIDPVAESIGAVTQSVASFTAQLVQSPSRSGVDSYETVFRLTEDWLTRHELVPRRLQSPSGDTVALVCDVQGRQPGPRYVLDACIDTAPFGEEALWTYAPTSGAVVDGWLHGRGSADCKAAVALFSHIAAWVNRHIDQLTGTLTLLFDADEHSGGFGGAKAYFGNGRVAVDGVMIGYPGNDEVVVGSRGFLRARITIHGSAGHSGGRRADGNAVEKAAELVAELKKRPLPKPTELDHGMVPKLTVTAVHGGEGFSIIPDMCDVNVDVRLMPSFTPAVATELITSAVRELDRRIPSGHVSDVQFEESWPAYVLSPSSPIVEALTTASMRISGHQLRTKIAGPSNIGNYLASRGIEATAGYGVRYRNLHGTDECIDLASIEPVYAVYSEALRTLLGMEKS